MGLNLNAVMLGAEDAPKLIEFYNKILGEAVWKDDENHWHAWQVGTGSLVVGPHSEVKGMSPQPGRVMVGFETTDVQGDFDRIKGLGATVVAEPYHPGESPEMWLATFADPEGNYFQLASPMKP